MNKIATPRGRRPIAAPTALALIGVLGLAVWQFGPQRPPSLPGPDLSVLGSPISAEQAERDRFVPSMATTLSTYKEGGSIILSPTSKALFRREPEGCRLLVEEGNGKMTVARRWSSTEVPCKNDRVFSGISISPDRKWGIYSTAPHPGLLIGKKGLPFEFSVHAVRLVGRPEERKWRIRSFVGQYGSPWAPEWRADSRAWRLWRAAEPGEAPATAVPPPASEVTPPPGAEAASGLLTAGTTPQPSVLIEAEIEAADRTPRPIWRGQFIGFPPCVAFLEDGAAMAVVPESPPLKPGVTRMTVQTQTGSHTVRIANPPRDGGALHFLRYREPIVEEPEQEYRVAVPALPVLAGHDSLLGYLSPDGQRIAFVFGHEPVFYERTETDYLRKDLLGKMPPKRLVHPAGTHVWVAELRGGPPRFLGRIQEGPGATYSRHEIAWTRDGTALLLPLGEKDPRPQTRHRQRWWRIPVGG